MPIGLGQQPGRRDAGRFTLLSLLRLVPLLRRVREI
jgi:hypothetical protein